MTEPTLTATAEIEAPEAETTDEVFDEARAKEKIRKANSEAENLRKRLKELEPQAAKARELEESQKTEQQRMAERLAELEKTGQSASLTALRYEVALDKGLTKTQAMRLIGTTVEELAADADALLADFGGKPASTRKPTERLRGGSDPEAEPEPDPEKVAAAISGRRF